MTQAEKDKIIKELQEKLAEAEKIEVDEPKRWKPNKYEEYYVINSSGSVDDRCWDDDDYDVWNYLTGNCFKTEEEAEEYKKQIEYTARYKNYIEEHSEPLDWKNNNRVKYSVYFDHAVEKIETVWDVLQRQGVVYASNEQITQDAIKEIGEDNFKKYVLGVK